MKHKQEQLENLIFFLVYSYLDDTDWGEGKIPFSVWLEQAKLLEKYKYHIKTFEYLIGDGKNGKSSK